MLFKQKAEVMVDHISKHLREAGQEEISDEERKVEVERLPYNFNKKATGKTYGWGAFSVEELLTIYIWTKGTYMEI